MNAIASQPPPATSLHPHSLSPYVSCRHFQQRPDPVLDLETGMAYRTQIYCIRKRSVSTSTVHHQGQATPSKTLFLGGRIFLVSGTFKESSFLICGINPNHKASWMCALKCQAEASACIVSDLGDRLVRGLMYQQYVLYCVLSSCLGCLGPWYFSAAAAAAVARSSSPAVAAGAMHHGLTFQGLHVEQVQAVTKVQSSIQEGSKVVSILENVHKSTSVRFWTRSIAWDPTINRHQHLLKTMCSWGSNSWGSNCLEKVSIKFFA